MDVMLLKCSLDRCNVDGSKKMDIDKCVLSNGSPCYYLLIKNSESTPSESAWGKFNEFVDKNRDKK